MKKALILGFTSTTIFVMLLFGFITWSFDFSVLNQKERGAIFFFWFACSIQVAIFYGMETATQWWYKGKRK